MHSNNLELLVKTNSRVWCRRLRSSNLSLANVTIHLDFRPIGKLLQFWRYSTADKRVTPLMLSIAGRLVFRTATEERDCERGRHRKGERRESEECCRSQTSECWSRVGKIVCALIIGVILGSSAWSAAERYSHPISRIWSNLSSHFKRK